MSNSPIKYCFVPLRAPAARLNPKSPPKRRAFKDLPVGSPMLSHANGNIATRILSHANDKDGTSLNSDDSTATVHHKGHRFQPLDDDASIIEPKVASKRITFGLLHPENDTVEASPAFLKYRGRGFRRDYSLGVTALCPSHIIDRAATPDEAFQSINKLKALDFAFVKTPDGSYSYAILACRTLEPPIDSMNSSSHVLEEFMIFVVSNSGSTVKLRKSQWVECVRLVSVGGSDPVSNRRSAKRPNQTKLLRNTEVQLLRNNTYRSGGDWVPPNVISYPSTSRTGESESLIPSPSLHFILLPHLHKLFHVPEISSNANEKRKMGSNRSTSFRSTDAVSPVESVMVREMVVQLCDVAAMRSNASSECASYH
mmetsp:Transcript_37824/g.79214  ORF Transcript_37824/g.79214 Transcript_37824/m.79214 type:complete len:369 (+) Transcript_37824:71-1177(+)